MNCINRPVAYEIQTTSCCNGKCIICPHQEVVKRPIHMAQNLFEKILRDINEISPQGEGVLIIPYLNGEPLLDPHICERLNQIRNMLPKCQMELSTNLSMLNGRAIDAIIHNHIEDIRISCFGWKDSYNQSMAGLNFQTFLSQMRIFLNRMREEGMLHAVSLTVIHHPLLSQSDIDHLKEYAAQEGINLNLWGVLDRAGNVSSFSNNVSITEEDEQQKRYTCAQRRHLERIHITANGDVVLCCQDWRSTVILGHVAQSTLGEIWNNSDYQRLRAEIDTPGVPYPNLCKKCKILLEGAKW